MAGTRMRKHTCSCQVKVGSRKIQAKIVNNILNASYPWGVAATENRRTRLGEREQAQGREAETQNTASISSPGERWTHVPRHTQVVHIPPTCFSLRKIQKELIGDCEKNKRRSGRFPRTSSSATERRTRAEEEIAWSDILKRGKTRRGGEGAGRGESSSN